MAKVNNTVIGSRVKSLSSTQVVLVKARMVIAPPLACQRSEERPPPRWDAPGAGRLARCRVAAVRRPHAGTPDHRPLPQSGSPPAGRSVHAAMPLARENRALPTKQHPSLLRLLLDQ